MKTGSILIFRDYADGDMAQIRFHDDNKIQDNQFIRSDGTQSYFFTQGLYIILKLSYFKMKLLNYLINVDLMLKLVNM